MELTLVMDDTDTRNSPLPTRADHAVAGWQALSEDRAQQLAQEQERTSQLSEENAALKERLAHLEAQADAEPEPRFDANNPPRRIKPPPSYEEQAAPGLQEWWDREIRRKAL